MTTQEKINKYFREVEKVFGARESLESHFESLKNEQYLEIESRLQLSKGKTYWLKFEVDESELSSWVMSMLVSKSTGGSIGGVRLTEVNCGSVMPKEEFKTKLLDFINEL